MIYDDLTIAAKYLIQTHFVVRVLEVHPENQTVDVIQDMYEYVNSADGTFIVQNEFGVDVSAALKMPFVLFDVPIKQLRWGQFSIQCNPKKDDTGYLEIFTDNITSWIKNGSLAIPYSADRFTLESCVFVPFIPNLQNKEENYVSDNNTLAIKSENTSIIINDNGTENSIEVTTDKLTVTGDVEITGDISVTGNLDIEGDVSITGDLDIDGDVTVTNGDVTADGISLKNHTHGVGTLAVPVTSAEGSPSTITGSTGAAQ